MQRGKIIEAIVRSAIVPRYVNKFCSCAWRDDITAELYLYVCELPERTLEDIHAKGGMEAVNSYVGGLLINQLLSNNSRIYKKYMRHIDREHPTAEIWAGENTRE